MHTHSSKRNRKHIKTFFLQLVKITLDPIDQMDQIVIMNKELIQK